MSERPVNPCPPGQSKTAAGLDRHLRCSATSAAAGRATPGRRRARTERRTRAGGAAARAYDLGAAHNDG